MSGKWLLHAVCLWFAIAASSAHASDDAPPRPRAASTQTCTDGHDFDFWIGSWNIKQRILRTDGSWLELPASTHVERALGGCALLERWQGEVQFFWEGMDSPQRIDGLSVRALDPRSGLWSIHWMDTLHPWFDPPYVGGFRDGKGEFFREWNTPEGWRKGRITFSHDRENHVDWALAMSNDDGRTWTTLWTMSMTRETGYDLEQTSP